MPKVIQIASTHARSAGEQLGSDILTILTDEGEIFERHSVCSQEWVRVKLPWEQAASEVPFADCKNPDCPINCPDSHAPEFIESEPEVARG